MSGGRSGPVRQLDQTEMEYQLRRWPMFSWLSGDHLVEQAVHSIDIATWVMQGPPERANGMEGREVRTGPGTGNIFDHHVVEFTYPGGAKYFCQARQMPGVCQHVSETVHGTRGTLELGVGPYGGTRQSGYRGNNPYQQEHDDLFAAIRSNEPLFEGDYGAVSSMVAVLGRMATYSGREVLWDEAVRSDLTEKPEVYSMSADPPILPDASGAYPVAIPGITQAC